MDKIHAFVGHSFEEKDREIVRIFLDFLDTIKKSSGIEFEWDHAEEAQPLAISAKVIEKINGKNLFIGICTKKERVIRDEKLKKTILRSGLFASETDFEWKASDWVLQELGFCLGRGMGTVLLIEKGVRPISGLQADLEYIEFDRANPSQSFSRLLQQISSMEIKKDGIDRQEAQELNPNKPNSAPVKDEATIDYKEPLPNWTETDYFIALYFAITDKDIDTEAKIYQSYKATLDDASPQLINWECEYLLLKQKYKNEPAIEPIKKIISKHPHLVDLHSMLGRAYEQYDSYDLAYDEFNKVLTTENKWNIKYLDKAISTLIKSKGNDFAKKYLRNNTDKVGNNNEDKFKFLIVYAGLFKEDSPRIYCALMEAALAIKPEDSSSRFDLAYKYSEMDLNQESAFHYKILCQTSPTETHWNNLGVAYDRLNFHAKSIEAYLKSEELGGTLSMSNMARKLLNAGFIDQATLLCHKAMTFSNYDNKIISTLEAINERKESDVKSVDLIAEGTKAQREFLTLYANAFSSFSTTMKSGMYKHKECILDVQITGDKFKAFGVYEKEVTIGGLLSISISTPANQPSKKVTHKLTYLGDIYGDAIVAKVMRDSDDPFTLLGAAGATKDALIYFSNSDNSFYVSEYIESGSQENPYKISQIK